MLNKRGKSGHPCFVPDLRENAFRFSLLNDNTMLNKRGKSGHPWFVLILEKMHLGFHC